jgi:pimeloyl-ACP methyl ester carboxylesterase
VTLESSAGPAPGRVPPGAARDAELTSTSARGLARLERAPVAEGPLGGALVLLVHGSMDRCGSFRRTMRHLPDATVLTYDRRGYGDSAAAPTSRRFEDQVDDLLDVLGGRTAIGVGHSFGAAVVAAAAVRRPDLLDSIVCFEPPQPWQPWWPADTPGGAAMGDGEPGDLAERFMRRMIGDEVWERLPAVTRERRRAEGAALREEMWSLRDGPAFDAAAITVPVLAGAGTEGSDHRRRSARALAEAAPLGRYEEVPGSDHGVHLSHPAALAELAKLALTRRGGGA